MKNKRPYIFIFSAPSGAGKTTIVKRILEHFPHFAFSISATTRSPRAHEQHGKDYYFLKQEEFKTRIEAGAFLEWEEVYEGLFYGTLRAEVDRLRDAGKQVLFDVDVKGGINIKQAYGPEAVSFFIQPPSLQVLRQRLEARGTNSPEDIERRCAKAAYELQFAEHFDHIILNDELEEAVAEVSEILAKSLNSDSRPSA
jgi:guanylate kinase